MTRESSNPPLSASADGLSRRNILVAATAAAGALTVAPGALADTAAAENFGAPVVELTVPAGTLSPEQKSALIKGITDVVRTAMKQPTDPPKFLFMAIIETAESGFGVNGQVFVLRK